MTKLTVALVTLSLTIVVSMFGIREADAQSSASAEASRYNNELGTAIKAALEARAELGISPRDTQLTKKEAQAVVAAMNSALAKNRGVTTLGGWPYGLNRFEVWLCARQPGNCRQGKRSANDSFAASANRYPRYSGLNDRRDAFRHAYWMALTTMRTNKDFAYRLGNAHEADGPNNAEKRMDLFNNYQGRHVALDHPRAGAYELANRCQWRERHRILRIRP